MVVRELRGQTKVELNDQVLGPAQPTFPQGGPATTLPTTTPPVSPPK
jgi:hypothetical protein